MSYYLETDRIYLRPICQRDGQNLFELNQDPEVMRYLTQEFKTLEDANMAALRIQSLIKKYHGRFGLFAAIEKGSKNFMGWFILRPDQTSAKDVKNLEIGYRLKRKYWGQGHGTEVSEILLEMARNKFSARRVYATAMIGNQASINIMKKIGLYFEKEYVDQMLSKPDKRMVLYSLNFEQEKLQTN